MVRTIDINRKEQVRPKRAPQRVIGKPQDLPALPPDRDGQVVDGKQNFITRFIDIMVYDILHKFHMVPERPEKTIEVKEDKEKYEEFCRLALGEKR